MVSDLGLEQNANESKFTQANQLCQTTDFTVELNCMPWMLKDMQRIVCTRDSWEAA